MPAPKTFTVSYMPIKHTEYGFETVFGYSAPATGSGKTTIEASTTEELAAKLTELGDSLPFPEPYGVFGEEFVPDGYSLTVKPESGRWPAGFKARFERAGVKVRSKVPV